MIKVGILGCGFMGKMHANVYDTLPNAQLVAVADIRPEAASELAGQHSAKAYDSLARMLAAEKLDMVDICLPTYLHADAAVEATKAGCSVLCEKPMAMNLEEADRMIEAARSSGVQLMIAHCIRFWPEYMVLKDYVDNKKLGPMLSINLTRVSPLPGWGWEDWNIDEARSGAAALDLHIHDTDFILYLLGQPDTIYARGVVSAHGLNHMYTTMTFGKVVAHLEGGWDFPADFPFKMAFRAAFENGAILWDGGPLTVYENGKEPFQPKIETISAADLGGNISDMGGYYWEIKYFVDCLESGQPLKTVTPESSRQSLAVSLQEIAQAKGV
ncbi:MAG: Gfo/Idh/MocA family oxidoreductase [Armatimonadetes bacterium]|nr:Gfo/Idh/MocA family oxidoreductase [Armatimonadota bacterium]